MITRISHHLNSPSFTAQLVVTMIQCSLNSPTAPLLSSTRIWDVYIRFSLDLQMYKVVKARPSQRSKQEALPPGKGYSCYLLHKCTFHTYSGLLRNSTLLI